MSAMRLREFYKRELAELEKKRPPGFGHVVDIGPRNANGEQRCSDIFDTKVEAEVFAEALECPNTALRVAHLLVDAANATSENKYIFGKIKDQREIDGESLDGFITAIDVCLAIGAPKEMHKRLSELKEFIKNILSHNGAFWRVTHD